MPAPLVATYSAAALVAAHTAFKTLVDAGGAAGSIKLRSAADALLGQIALTYPCGTVNGSTGQLALGIASASTFGSDGTVAYAEVCSSAGTVHLSLPTQAGTVAVPGYAVVNTLTAVVGGAVSVVSATIG